jgi:MarR family transcriptional regulator, transcriptional regulator for hemolysin
MRDVIEPRTTRTSRDVQDDTIGRWVKLAFVAMRRELEASLRATGMTLTQWRSLGMLLRHPGMTHSELVRQLEIEAPSVTSLVNGMERRGWVKRTRSATDARVKRLFLTARGRKLIGVARKATGPVEERMAAALSEEERATLKKLLRIVVEGIR